MLKANRKKWLLQRNGNLIDNWLLNSNSLKRSEYLWSSEENNCKPKIIYLVKIFFKNIDKIVIFRQQLRTFTTTKSTLESILNNILKSEERLYYRKALRGEKWWTKMLLIMWERSVQTLAVKNICLGYNWSFLDYIDRKNTKLWAVKRKGRYWGIF